MQGRQAIDAGPTSGREPRRRAICSPEDGVLELPYLASLGVPPKYTGPDAIATFLTFLHEQLYPGFVFKDVTVHIDTPDQVFAGYVIDATSGISGKTVHQQFYGHLTARDGKIECCARRSMRSSPPRPSSPADSRRSPASARRPLRPEVQVSRGRVGAARRYRASFRRTGSSGVDGG
ncbi:MAG: nuclear transport factor 2 family protein [Caulobacteraceae bacterium]